MPGTKGAKKIMKNNTIMYTQTVRIARNYIEVLTEKLNIDYMGIRCPQLYFVFIMNIVNDIDNTGTYR